jgi:hypothetical protein
MMAGLVAAASAATFSTAAQADYFIRPYVQLGAGVVDGLDVNGETEGSAFFTNDLQAKVDLTTGTVHNYLKITGPDAGGSGFGQSAGIFGDRLHFDAAQGSNIGFSFGFDGTIKSPARVVPTSTQQIGVIANLRVFDISAGATYQNFTSLSGALVSDSVFLDFSNPSAPIDEMIARTLAGSLTVAGNATYDVFASFSMFASLNENPVTVEMDFLNTGRFGIQAGPGVSYTSDSGVFLTGGSAAVPEPASWAMMIAGFALAGRALRRRQGARVVWA